MFIAENTAEILQKMNIEAISNVQCQYKWIFLTTIMYSDGFNFYFIYLYVKRELVTDQLHLKL